jgi:hypothetical protein
MSLDEASLGHYSHYSSFPCPPDFRLEPSTDIIYLSHAKSFAFKTNPDHFPLDASTTHRQSSIDTMASTQPDDMEAFQSLSDQYQPEVAVSYESITQGTESTLIVLGAIGGAEATHCSIDQRVC